MSCVLHPEEGHGSHALVARSTLGGLCRSWRDNKDVCMKGFNATERSAVAEHDQQHQIEREEASVMDQARGSK